MLVIRVEVWPKGKEAHKKLLGQAVISNDRTGSEELGNYDAEFRGDGKTLRAKVAGFPRTMRFWSLICVALNNAIGAAMEAQANAIEPPPADTTLTKEQEDFLAAHVAIPTEGGIDGPDLSVRTSEEREA